MASVVDICNSALNLLGASTITALTDDSKNARLCNQRYEPVRNRIFRSHAWNCLTKRVQLAQDSSAPVVEYSYQYTLPSDCLRVLKIHTGVTDSIESDIDYKVETATDFAGQTGTLDPTAAAVRTNAMSHKIHGEIFHRWNFFELTLGLSQIIAGRSIPKESEVHFTFDVYF